MASAALNKRRRIAAAKSRDIIREALALASGKPSQMEAICRSDNTRRFWRSVKDWKGMLLFLLSQG